MPLGGIGTGTSMRAIEFEHATDDQGMMSFRVNLLLNRAQQFGKAAADGQLGCILKIYREWQLSGDDTLLRSLWPEILGGKVSLREFALSGHGVHRWDGIQRLESGAQRVFTVSKG